MRVLDDFKCDECGEVKEVMHDNEAEAIMFCECGGRMVKTLGFKQNFRFYGGGTYMQHTKGD